MYEARLVALRWGPRDGSYSNAATSPVIFDYYPHPTGDAHSPAYDPLPPDGTLDEAVMRATQGRGCVVVAAAFKDAERAGILDKLGVNEELRAVAATGMMRQDLHEVSQVFVFRLLWTQIQRVKQRDHLEVLPLHILVDTKRNLLIALSDLDGRDIMFRALQRVDRYHGWRNTHWRHGAWMAWHALLMEVASSFEEPIARMSERVHNLERDTHRSSPSRDHLASLREVKSEMIRLKRTALDSRQVFGKLAYLMADGERKELTDMLEQAAEQARYLDDQLNFVLNSVQASIDIDQNGDMRKIASWGSIAVVWTLIVGIYQITSDLKWLHVDHPVAGFVGAIVLALAVTALLYWRFNKIKWL